MTLRIAFGAVYVVMATACGTMLGLYAYRASAPGTS